MYSEKEKFECDRTIYLIVDFLRKNLYINDSVPTDFTIKYREAAHGLEIYQGDYFSDNLHPKFSVELDFQNSFFNYFSEVPPAAFGHNATSKLFSRKFVIAFIKEISKFTNCIIYDKGVLASGLRLQLLNDRYLSVIHKYNLISYFERVLKFEISDKESPIYLETEGNTFCFDSLDTFLHNFNINDPTHDEIVLKTLCQKYTFEEVKNIFKGKIDISEEQYLMYSI